MEHRRFWLHRFPATATEARMTVLLSRRHQINLGENDTPRQQDQVRVETFVIPAGDTTSNAVDSTPELTQDFAPPWAAAFYSESVEETMLPAGFIKVTPSLKDENGNDVSNSDMPKAIPETNEMVEEPRPGQIPNVAYRILKAKVPERMEGETVRWSMTPQFTPEGGAQPGIRGQWPEAHPDRFEPDEAENYYLFQRVSQMEGRTTIDNTGETAVRINLPPIGFNKVRVKMEFENYPAAFLEIDFEVPAIVVIDPGHGGKESDPVVAGSSWNNARSPSGVLEKTMALDFGLSLQDALRTKANQDKLNIRVFMTRKVDENPSGAQRAHIARDNGADVIFVIHFNSDDDGDPAHGRPPHRSRGTLEVVRTTNNVVAQQDADLSDRVINRIVDALHQLGDAGAIHRAQVFFADRPAVASDLNIGNTQAYHPIRVGYCEAEFIDYGANTIDPADDEVDILLNTGPNAATARAAIVSAMRDGIIDDLKRQPATP